MAVRIKDWMIPYTWWVGIEITNNHVINVLLRAVDNLIHANENRELYVDLQLPTDITPDDELPIGVNIWRVLSENGWFKSWTLISGKTSSSDFLSFLYSDDGHLYYNPWSAWMEIADSSAIVPILEDLNTKTFYIADNQDTQHAQLAYNWYAENKDPILIHDNRVYTLTEYEEDDEYKFLSFTDGEMYLEEWPSFTFIKEKCIKLTVLAETDTVTWIFIWDYGTQWQVLETGKNYATPYVPEYNGSPATKQYVDLWLATKQDTLTPWPRITIDQNNVISADISGVLTYKWNVTSQADLPSSWNTVWDCYFVTTDQLMFAWDGTQWNQVWSTQMDLTNYFNKTTDDSDDITQWSQNLFVTPSEKSTWNNKQDKIIAWTNITIWNDWKTINAVDTTYSWWDYIDITNNVISNEKPFIPENQWTLSQILKRTVDGYHWANEVITRINWQIWDITINDFDPENTGTTGQVLKKTDTWYAWANESWWGGWWGWNFNPTHSGTEWQVLTKGTWDSYDWKNLELPSGENNVKFWTIDSGDTSAEAKAVLQEIAEWIQADEQNWAIINDTHIDGTYKWDTYIYNNTDTSWAYPVITFFWVNRNSEKRTWKPWWVSHWDFTVAWQWELDIITWPNYSLFRYENPNDLTHTNYISAVTQWIYTDPFIPTEWYQPATKQYVDDSIRWWWIPYQAGNGIDITNNVISNTWVTNNVTWTTYTLQQEWAWTQTQFNNLWSYVNWVIYNILPDN